MRHWKRSSKHLFSAVAIAGVLLVGSVADATVLVSLSPANQTVAIGDGVAVVDIIALIPEDDAVVGWGLDLSLAGTSAVLDTVTVNEPTWSAVAGADGDALAGLAPSPPGVAIWSDPAAIVLATVTFTLDGLGVTDLSLRDDNPADLSEGFALDPPPVGAFADVVYTGGSITVIPEPASVVMVVLGGLCCVLRRR